MEITVGMDKGFAHRPGGRAVLQRLAGLGVTSVETYVRWIDFEPEEGRLDWSVFDADLAALRECGLRWVPFLIGGPWYATPQWFRQGPRSVLARCLEHGRETGSQSIWNPHLPAEVRRIVGAFADRYAGDAVESVLLGIAGDYGEAIQTVTGNWPGDYHGHGGYWCGDAYALDDFRAWLRARHGDADGLRRAWGEGAPGRWEDVRPPRAPSGCGRRAWLDFVQWYREAMTAWAGRWMREVRAAMPAAEVYLCTGGDMLAAHGSDFSAQCRAAAEAGAGVRITNEGSDYVQNLMLTRLVPSACRTYGTFCGFEPAAAVTAQGVAARQFNAAGSGARQLHEYQNNIVAERGAEAREVPGATAAWRRGLPLVRPRRPRYEVAVVHSLPDLALREAGILGGALALARALRPWCDFEVLDDHLVEAGALGELKAAFLAPSRLWAEGTLERLRDFAAGGGIVVASAVPPAAVEGDGAGAAALFGFGSDTEELTGISRVVAAPDAPMPAYAGKPPMHSARSYRGLAADTVPLLRLAHTPAVGGIPLAMWYRAVGRGAAVFYAGSFSRGEDWMAVQGAAEALLHDLLTALPAALGLAPVEVCEVPGVYETVLEDGRLGWNASDGEREWRGGLIGAGEIGERA